MITLTTTHRPATDLGYLLLKNPARCHEVDLAFGKALVLFPEATEERCSVTLLLDVDPVDLVRSPGGSLSQYVNDRPYVASSHLSTALKRVFGTAMSGKCKERPELVETALPFEVEIPAVPSRTGEAGIRRLFEPLGYSVETSNLPLDDHFPEWGLGPYFKVRLSAAVTVRALLMHLFICLPVLDGRKHYFTDDAEVEKLISKGEGWLATHPDKEWIVRSYLVRKPSLIQAALEQLANAEPELEEEATSDAPEDLVEPQIQRKSLHQQRHDRVIEEIRRLKPQSLVDLGCGDGKLLRQLIPIQGLNRIVGMDVSYFELTKAHRKLRLERAGPRLSERVQLIHGSLMYRDSRIEGFDVATAVEVIEHLDEARLAAFERVLFECARPKFAIITTPNADYNPLYETMTGMRHEDHRFEWSREEFQNWAQGVAERYGYTATIEGLGEAHETLGSPSQMGVFSR